MPKLHSELFLRSCTKGAAWQEAQDKWPFQDCTLLVCSVHLIVHVVVLLLLFLVVVVVVVVVIMFLFAFLRKRVGWNA